MCQCQLSSVLLPSGAATPPCAATVWERVGKTLVSTAVFRLPRESSSAARMPEPPAPTTMASNLRTAKGITSAPQDLHRPAEIGKKQKNGHHVQRKAHALRPRVVHQDIAHADPR